MKPSNKFFEASFFLDNCKRLLNQTNAKLIVVSAAARLQSNTDEAYPFRQDSDFWYLTGIEEPGCLLVLTKSEQFIIMPRRPAHADMWEGAIDFEALKLKSGIDNIMANKDGWKALHGLLKNSPSIHTQFAPPPYLVHHQFYVNPARHELIRRLKRAKPDIQLTDIKPHIASMRLLKQPQEILAMKHCMDITGAGIKKILAEQPSTEYEAEALLTYEFRRQGATGHAFAPILANGKNATTLHYNANTSKRRNQDMLLVDCGARAEFYNADVTRVLPPIAGFSTRQREVVLAVTEIQHYAFSKIKKGLAISEYERLVTERMGVALKNLNLISNAKNIQRIRRYYPHSIGHQLGLDVHDVTSSGGKLQAGMVMTVEPGIYIPEEGIGVRIEDDILITENGYENLSGHWLPTEELLQ